MLDTIIIGGFTDYKPKDTFALEKPFLLYKNNILCDIPGLYKTLVDPAFYYNPADIEAPPLVCYVIKQILFNHGFQSEMIFYLDFDSNRLETIFSEPCKAILLSTTLISNKILLKKAVEIIKHYANETPILCGGPFVDRSWFVRHKLLIEKKHLYTPCKDDHLFLKNSDEDSCGVDLFLICDPGLEVAMQILARLKKGKMINDIFPSLPNCALVKESRWCFSSQVNLTPPIIQEINWSIFRSDELALTVPMIHSRGCTNKCAFCNFKSLSAYKEKQREVLRNEIISLFENHEGIKNIFFCDDNLCYNKESLNNFLNIITELELGIKWISFIDARFIDEKIGEKLKQSGCILLKIGMESGDDIMLKNMRKPCRTRNYREAVNFLSKEGISIDAYFIIGFPGETSETIQNTIDMVNSFPTPYYSANQIIFFPFVLAPLAPVFEKEMRRKYKLKGYCYQWEHQTMDYKTAIALVPDIIKNIKTMQPMHGNLDKLLLYGNNLLSEIDKMRGEFVRMKLFGNAKSDVIPWRKLRKLVSRLNPYYINTGENMNRLVKFE